MSVSFPCLLSSRPSPSHLRCECRRGRKRGERREESRQRACNKMRHSGCHNLKRFQLNMTYFNKSSFYITPTQCTDIAFTVCLLLPAVLNVCMKSTSNKEEHILFNIYDWLICIKTHSCLSIQVCVCVYIDVFIYVFVVECWLNPLQLLKS